MRTTAKPKPAKEIVPPLPVSLSDKCIAPCSLAHRQACAELAVVLGTRPALDTLNRVRGRLSPSPVEGEGTSALWRGLCKGLPREREYHTFLRISLRKGLRRGRGHSLTSAKVTPRSPQGEGLGEGSLTMCSPLRALFAPSSRPRHTHTVFSGENCLFRRQRVVYAR